MKRHSKSCLDEFKKMKEEFERKAQFLKYLFKGEDKKLFLIKEYDIVQDIDDDSVPMNDIETNIYDEENDLRDDDVSSTDNSPIE